ncbi:MAG: hypothetical protein AB8I80_07295 [Anaerolineae bacterium]
MSDDITNAQHEVELGFLEDIFVALGYDSVHLFERSEELSLPTLAVGLEPDAKGRGKNLALAFYPVAEFEDTNFLQYYIELPFEVDQEGQERLLPLLPYVNQRLVIGHFGMTDGENKLHYRYVQALPSLDMITEDKVKDVIAIVEYSPVLFEGILEQTATGVVSLDQARRLVEQQLSE